MSEMITKPIERKLWFEGGNYAADAVVIDPVANKLLLIQRPSGDWALPGGFVDATDPSSEFAAAREAMEEVDLTPRPSETLLFKGVVDDPRNSGEAWIETSAYLFYADCNEPLTETKEAVRFAWKHFDDIPRLYASHGDIVTLGLDYLTSLRKLHRPDMITSMTRIDGGHMQYDKNIFELESGLMFSKAHRDENFTDENKAERSKLYLQKEARVMSHLRTNGFRAVPEHSALLDSTLLMEAFSTENDWRWRAPNDNVIAHYIADTLAAFDELEAMPLLADTFDIEPSYVSFEREGWQALDEPTLSIVRERAERFYHRMNDSSQDSAKELMSNIDSLRDEGIRPHRIGPYVTSHHDARQSNIAWHPDHGVKLVDWSWFGAGEQGSDATNFLIDIHKSGHDITDHLGVLNEQHCLTLIGFWLVHASWPVHTMDDSVRFQQFVSAVSAYEVLKMLRKK